MTFNTLQRVPISFNYSENAMKPFVLISEERALLADLSAACSCGGLSSLSGASKCAHQSSIDWRFVGMSSTVPKPALDGDLQIWLDPVSYYDRASSVELFFARAARDASRYPFGSK